MLARSIVPQEGIAFDLSVEKAAVIVEEPETEQVKVFEIVKFEFAATFVCVISSSQNDVSDLNWMVHVTVEETTEGRATFVSEMLELEDIVDDREPIVGDDANDIEAVVLDCISEWEASPKIKLFIMYKPVLLDPAITIL